jgi:hypothetical protein
MSELDDPVWCPDCGGMRPWKHKYQPTWRARVARAIVRTLGKITERVEQWRDAERGPKPR